MTLHYAVGFSTGFVTCYVFLFVLANLPRGR